MNEVIDLSKNKARKRTGGALRLVVVILSSIVLSTVGIKAADTLINKKDTAVTPSGCPAEMVGVPAATGNFCIDKYEASASGVCPATDPQNQEQTRQNLEDQNCRAVSAPGMMPWRNISQNQAAIACARSGKRLPTSAEWLAASLGTPDKASNWTSDDCLVADNWDNNNGPGHTGAGKNCLSAAGAFDMIGNVWEWTSETIAEGKFQSQTLPKQGYVKSVDQQGMPTETSDLADSNYMNDYLWIKASGTRSIARGGYWDNRDQAGQYSAYMVVEPSFAGDGIGFRCVK